MSRAPETLLLGARVSHEVSNLLDVLGCTFDLPIQWSHQFQDRSDLTLQRSGDLYFADSFEEARRTARAHAKAFATQ